ncbi:hypothetical protein B7463_g3044, partial [Scytalidium lignicola]
MDDGTDKAANVCASCKQYKRKCNKTLPSCSTCSRLHRACNYSTLDFTRARPKEEIALLRARVEELEKLIERSIAVNTPGSTLPASSPIKEVNDCGQSSQSNLSSRLFFLDQRTFTHLHCRLPLVSVPLPNKLVNALGDEHCQPRGMEQLVSRYFDTFHGWMPIISKTRMKRVLDRSAGNIQAEMGFLLSCMKLLLQKPENEALPEDISLYGIVKADWLQLEMVGLQSLEVVQGGILIGVYELSHGIYPAAYMSVAQCARQAISIGLHNCEAPEFLQPWADWEEEIRVWWFIVILDRYVTIGRELRPLCTEDPKKHTPLPADTEAWDQGAMISPERLYASSPATAITSPYARLAQAFNLLGRVIRHCDDQDQDIVFMLEEMNTLHQATCALLDLIKGDESEDSYVALSVLVDKAGPKLAPSIREYTERSLNTMRDASLQALDLAQELERRVVVSGVDKLSPLVMHCLYRAAFWLSYLAGVNREERFIIGRSIIDRVLKALSSRWKIAGIYLEMLEAVHQEGR